MKSHLGIELCIASLSLCACASAAQKTPQVGGLPQSPEQHLGRPVGADFQLADWREVSGFYEQLASRSTHVQLFEVGTTTEGRDFLLAAISSQKNLARLDEIKQSAAALADPRGLTDEAKRRALEQCVPILMISIAMHSTETAAPQFGMELAWRLATSNDEPYASARERLVVLVIPCTNPDGLDHVVEWYRATLGTPHEASSLPKLYQHYAGHDNNRDWFMLTQAETRIVTEQLYAVWHPHVYWDVHQQGQSAERMFVPPFRDPLNPNLDPAVMAGINLIGTRALLDMTREGLSGVATGVTFDQWWNGGNRNVPVRHNIIGLLTEAASVNVASPVFLEPSRLRPPGGKGSYAPTNQFPLPWPGGWWRLRDIIDYEHAFARSVLRSLTAEPRTWLESALATAERVIAKGREDNPRAWVIPSDNEDRGAVRRLVDTLLCGGVEVHVATSPVAVDGREYASGSIVILREQPYGQHVKDLLEVQRYPDGDPPYDVAGWTLPFLLGVHRVECVRVPQVELARVATADEAVARFVASDTSLGWAASDSDRWREVFAALANDAVTWDRSTAAFVAGAKEGEGRRVIAKMPRIGLYAPWSGSMDEGWTRWVFDTWALPYVTVRNEMLRAGKLASFLDVLVLPDVGAASLDQGRALGSAPDEFTGGLDPEGAVAVEEFVRRGGTLIAWRGSAAWAVELFGLPLVDAVKEKKKDGEVEFSCPGSVLRAIPEDSLYTAGLPASVALFCSGGNAWRADEPKKGEKKDERKLETLLRYAPTRLLMSGWIRSPETIEGRAAWLRAQHGEGVIHLFGFCPQYRGWSQSTFQLVFRAALLDGAPVQ